MSVSSVSNNISSVELAFGSVLEYHAMEFDDVDGWRLYFISSFSQKLQGFILE